MTASGSVECKLPEPLLSRTAAAEVVVESQRGVSVEEGITEDFAESHHGVSVEGREFFNISGPSAAPLTRSMA